MEYFNADEARELMKQAIISKKNEELDNVFKAIQDACYNGKFVAYLDRINYKETIDTLKELGYVVNSNCDGAKRKWCSYTISWVKRL